MMSRKIKIQLGIVISLAALALILTVVRVAGLTGSTADESVPTLTVVSSHGAETAPVKGEKPEMAWWSVLKLVGAMAVVIGAIYGFLFILRKMMGRKLSSNRGNRILEVLETTYIGQKKSISLVRFGEKSILIGTSENSISALSELDADETARLMGEMTSEKGPAGFRNFLSEAREKYKTLRFRRISGFNSGENKNLQST